jgi:hypothetical protein
VIAAQERVIEGIRTKKMRLEKCVVDLQLQVQGLRASAQEEREGPAHMDDHRHVERGFDSDEGQSCDAAPPREAPPSGDAENSSLNSPAGLSSSTIRRVPEPLQNQPVRPRCARRRCMWFGR